MNPRPQCETCGYRSLYLAARGIRYDGTAVERWRCGLCGRAWSFVVRPARRALGRTPDDRAFDRQTRYLSVFET